MEQAPAVPAAAPAAGGDAANNANNNGGGGGIFSTIFRMMLFYYLAKTFMGGGGSSNAPADPKAPRHGNAWDAGVPIELRVFLRENNDRDNEQLIWHVDDITYDDRNFNFKEFNYSFVPSHALQHNGTVSAHVVYSLKNAVLDAKNPKYDPAKVFHFTHSLVRYFPRPKKVNKKNLISGTPAEIDKLADVPKEQENEIISFFVPTLHLGLVFDHSEYAPNAIPPQMIDAMQFVPRSEQYYPPLFVNEFWLMREHLQPLNETVSLLNMTMSHSPFSLFKWQIMTQMMQSWKMQTENFGSTDSEIDEFKRMLLETNPYLLVLTFCVSLLHSIFDFLAFKNDIQHWKNKKTMEGTSVRSIFISVGMQFVIFLYLFDNETSYMVLIPSGIGLFIEMWKIKKACIVTLDNHFPFLHVSDRESYRSATKTYDETAIRYMSYLLYPLLIIYSIYSLFYHEYKSYYSFVLNTLVGGVYTFGFLLMTPQLYINYKLKSVAHLPFRTFVYKALNTFIDDLFAFIIKMPTLHRLACFRDDLIFLIFLYQRWIYKVDKNRINEFGQGGSQENSENIKKIDSNDQDKNIDDKKKD